MTGKENFPIKYLLPGGKIGLGNFGDYLKALGGFSLFYGPLLYTRALGQTGSRQSLDRQGRDLARQVRRYLEIRLFASGLKQINPAESYIIAPLHESFVDVLALAELPLNMRFVARDELFDEWPLLGPLLRDTGQISVCPEEGLKSFRKLVKEAEPVFASGESLVIFPQGALLGIEADFNIGAFALARHYRKPILPVVLAGGHRVWEYPFNPRLRFGQSMVMRVLPPLPPELFETTPLDEIRLNLRREMKRLALAEDLVQPRHYVPSRDDYWDGFTFKIDPDFPELAADIARHRREYQQRQNFQTEVLTSAVSLPLVS